MHALIRKCFRWEIHKHTARIPSVFRIVSVISLPYFARFFHLVCWFLIYGYEAWHLYNISYSHSFRITRPKWKQSSSLNFNGSLDSSCNFIIPCQVWSYNKFISLFSNIMNVLESYHTSYTCRPSSLRNDRKPNHSNVRLLLKYL